MSEESGAMGRHAGRLNATARVQLAGVLSVRAKRARSHRAQNVPGIGKLSFSLAWPSLTYLGLA